MKLYTALKTNGDFHRLYKRGKSLVCGSAVIYYMRQSRFKTLRLGITVGKKIGGAVERNRAKRVIRAAFQSVAPKIDGYYDFVIVARTRVLNTKSTALAADFERLLAKSEILNTENE